MSNHDHKTIGYWYEWSGTSVDGEIVVPSGMLMLTSNTRAKVLGEIAQHFATLDKVISFDGRLISHGPARHYSRANPIPLTVQIDGDSQLNLFIYEAGATIQLIQDSPRG